MDEDNVQPDVVSPETPSPEVETPQPLTLTQEELTQKIDEAISKAVEEQTKKATREIQSVKDKSTAEVKRALERAGLAESTLQSVRTNLDDDALRDLELSELRAKDRHYQSREQEESQRQQLEVFNKSFVSQMNQFITNSGIDPTDKRIDWGDDAEDYLSKQQRILNSVTKIQKANVEAETEKRSNEFKEMEAKLRKDLGLDSVDLSAPVGGGELSEADKLKKRYPSMSK